MAVEPKSRAVPLQRPRRKPVPLFHPVAAYFAEVARQGSIRRAAEALHLTPSTVDRQVLRLEERLGVPLFERLPRGVRLTSAGELLLASLQRLEREFDGTVQQLEAIVGVRRGHASVWTLQLLVDSVLPVAVDAVRRSHPEITLSAVTATTEDITRAVLADEADAGVCWEPGAGLPLTVEFAVPLRLGVVVVPDHALARRATTRLRDCLEHPLILPRTGMELRSHIDRVRRATALEARPAFECNSIPLIKRVVAQGAGMAFLTSLDVVEEVKARTLRFLPLEDRGIPALRLCLITRARRRVPAAAAALIGALDAALRAFAGAGAAP